MEGTKILPCLCEHKDQDQMYGRGMRAHNRVDGKGKPLGYACTVCTPRRLPCEKNSVAIEPVPHMGMFVRIPARPNRVLKSIDSQSATGKKKK